MITKIIHECLGWEHVSRIQSGSTTLKRKQIWIWGCSWLRSIGWTSRWRFYYSWKISFQHSGEIRPNGVYAFWQFKLLWNFWVYFLNSNDKIISFLLNLLYFIHSFSTLMILGQLNLFLKSNTYNMNRE